MGREKICSMLRHASCHPRMIMATHYCADCIGLKTRNLFDVTCSPSSGASNVSHIDAQKLPRHPGSIHGKILRVQ